MVIGGGGIWYRVGWGKWVVTVWEMEFKRIKKETEAGCWH